MLLHLPPLRSSTPSFSYLLPRFRFTAFVPPPERRLSPKLLHHFISSTSSGDDGGRWKLAGIDRDVVQQRLSSWLLKAQTLITDVTTPLVKPGVGRKPDIQREPKAVDLEVFLALEMTVDRRTTPNGYLSFAAAVSIEQFGRMNGLTGRKMQRIFKALAPEGIQNDARSLVEYCCFRFLSRDTSDFHPNLKDPTFQKLIFITMLAWDQPYFEGDDSQFSLEKSSLQKRVVGESAFVRIAPLVAGVADTSTAHYLFRALVGDEHGISFSLWTAYVAELVKVHKGRKSYQAGNLLPTEQLFCIGYSRQRPVLKWEDNIALPGNLTLTDSALYFEGIQLRGYREPIRLDLTAQDSRVEKTKVGPFGSKLFDSAVSVSSGSKQETWILEFVDFGGELRRDVWHACISEVISLYEFIREYGPDDEDNSIHHVCGAHKGKKKAISSAANSIARLQSLQYIRKLPEDPTKLVQFSYLKNAPYGDIVLQTLAVNFWGGSLVSKFEQSGHRAAQRSRPSEDLSNGSEHVFDLDGSVYLCRWMKSSKWMSNSSVAFWKNSYVKRGIILAKNLAVSDLNLMERAALTCKERSQKVEKTQATIDAAMIKGIPSNIDLFKELLLPCTILAQKIDKLRRWEDPVWTLSFLVVFYAVIFRNLLQFVLPSILIISSIAMLLLKGLKEQGRLGRSFGKVTIHDQPPSNTIQKIVAVKEAISDLENRLQNLNISLLKFRTIVLAGQPEITTEVALLLLGSAVLLLLIPFKYIAAYVILDFFTGELKFRREMSLKLISFLKERWAAVYAASVVVLPYESEGRGSAGNDRNASDETKSHGIQKIQKSGNN